MRSFFNLLSLVILLLTMAGCTETTYENDDILANVRGEEITAGDVRFFYPPEDEDMEEALAYRIQEILIIQEAKKEDIDISDEINTDMTMGQYPSEDIDTQSAQDIREFAEKQAEIFEMEPEAYYEQYSQKQAEYDAYINAFIFGEFGEPTNDTDIEQYDRQIEEWLDQLWKANEDDIEVHIDIKKE